MCTELRSCPLCKCEACGRKSPNGRLKTILPDNIRACPKCYMDALNSSNWKPAIQVHA